MSGPVVVEELPDFDNPPVIEIVGAAQFVALPRLSLADMVHVGQQLDGYEFHELQQRDRIAVNERRREPSDDDPSSKTVWPELERLAGCVDETLVEEIGYGPSPPTVLEVTYVNRVDPVAGVWETHSELHFSRRLVVNFQTEDLAQSSRRATEMA